MFGYTKVTVDKSLVPDIALLKVHVDGVEYNCTIAETGNSWVVIFTYSHSGEGLVEIELGYIVPELQIPFLLLLLMMVSLFLVTRALAKKS